jgi:SAM-dependent methyltransferase
VISESKWIIKAGLHAIVRKKNNRQKSTVLDEYTAGWEMYAEYLDKCETLSDWLDIKGLEDIPSHCQIGGKTVYKVFNSGAFNKQKILESLQSNFVTAKSVTEYGCGLGRNLLFLKQQMPNVEFYGYELCEAGVEVANAAAKKFGLDIQFSQLDYARGDEADFIFPHTDVAYTMYSLEQLPSSNKEAVRNILNHTHLGSIHLEPVVENYPLTLRGLIGRLDHWKADYLSNFEKNISDLDIASFEKEVLDSSHNALMFPSIYVIKKA